MTERQIECFLCLSKTLNFNEAARQMYLTQPAISQQIQALETSLGVTLFNRSRSGVSLTASGVAFQAEAADYLQHYKNLLDNVRQKSMKHSTLCEICYAVPLNCLPQLIHDYHQSHPDTLVRICRTDFMLPNLQAFLDRCDVAVAFGDESEDYGTHSFIELYQGDFIAIMNPKNPLANKRLLTIEDMDGEMIFSLPEYLNSPFLHSFHGYLVAKHGIANFASCTNFWEASMIAEAGYGIAVLPNLMDATLPDSVTIPFHYPGQFHLGLFIRKNAPAHIREFCILAQKIAKDYKTNQVKV